MFSLLIVTVLSASTFANIALNVQNMHINITNSLIFGGLGRSFAARGLTYPRVFCFPTIGEYAPLLEAAGLRVTHAFLFDRPTPQQGPDGLRAWIDMFVRAPFAGMDAALREAIIADAMEQTRGELLRPDGTWIVDYVRIRLRAVKG